MRLAAPEWLLLLPALAALGWFVPGLRLRHPLRAMTLGVAALILADPQVRIRASGLDLWVVVDRSESAAHAVPQLAAEAEAILRRTAGRDDRVGWIDFAGEVSRRDAQLAGFSLGTRRSRIGFALEFAVSQRAPDRAARVLLLTDGFATEALDAAFEPVLRSGVPVDFRLVPPPPGDDLRVAALEAPVRVLPGEAFLLEATVVGRPESAPVPWTLERNGREAGRGTAQVVRGRARIRLTDRAPAASGAVAYALRIDPAGDVLGANNVASALVEVVGGPRVVVVTAWADDPLAAALRGQGFRVDVVTDPEVLRPSDLSGARLVVLHNVPAHRLRQGVLEAADFLVREQGGGLLMAGGASSFGSGGYYASAINDLLPVSLELRREERRLATAVAIALDRSGSMGAPVAGGRVKMDLANSGAARVVELLGARDAVAVHAVDTQAHTIVELAEVGPNRGRIVDAVSRIAVAGGGIYVGEALRAAWGQLERARTGQRHLILFADASDAEEPGDYEAFLGRVRAEGVTVSVIGLGTDADRDAALLRRIADLGGGRSFFSADPAQLPALFAQDTIAVARSLYVREPTAAAATPGWSSLAARPLASWPGTVDAFNLCYLRPGATASLLTADDDRAPLVATWVRGAGRVAAVTFPLAGPDAGRALAWPEYAAFVRTLARWLAGDDSPPGLGLALARRGERLEVELLHDPRWTGAIAASAPLARIAVATVLPGDAENAPAVADLGWERIEPGRLRASLPLDPGTIARGAVRVGDAVLPFGPVAGPPSAEWEQDGALVAALRQLSARSGGVERVNLGDVWDAPRPALWSDLRPWLLGAFLLLVLAEALATRLGWRSQAFSRWGPPGG